MRTNQKSNLQEALEQLDVEDYLSYIGVDFRVTQGRSGTQLNIRECPRCGGSKWKVYLNADTGLGNCFHGSCVGEPGFNAYTFSEHFLGSGKEASQEIIEYAKNTGWRPKKKRAPVTIGVNNGDIQLPDSIELPYQGRNLSYLTDRGITVETVQALHWRYSLEGVYRYTGFDNQQRSQSYKRRVIIPVYNINGELVTFQGRDITGTAENKYIFPPGLPGTARYLYNAHNAVGAEKVVLCEGAFDVAATIQALGKDRSVNWGVVGTFGKVLSHSKTGENDQLSDLAILKASGAREFIFLWDGEVKTQKDAWREALNLHSYGFATAVAQLPVGKDPNEVDPAVVRRAVHNPSIVTRQSMLRARLQLGI